MSNNAINPIGFCGKIPSKGDFVQSDFNSDFFTHWNDWLQAIVAVSKEQLSTDWLDCYLTSPIWHFSLSPGVCCDSAVKGTMIPSVDQVGRNFPFTVAIEHDNTALDAWLLKEWSHRTEQHILDVLEDNLDLDAWFEKLIKELPNLTVKRSKFIHNETNDRTKKAWVVTGDISPEVVDLLHIHYSKYYHDYSVWWTLGSELVTPCFVVTSGLPQVSQFVAMITGQWLENSWNTSELIKE